MPRIADSGKHNYGEALRLCAINALRLLASLYSHGARTPPQGTACALASLCRGHSPHPHPPHLALHGKLLLRDLPAQHLSA